MKKIAIFTFVLGAGVALGCSLLGVGQGSAAVTGPTEGLVLKTKKGDTKFADLAKDGPVFLYFAKSNCGSNPVAIPLVQSLYKPYSEKVKMFAVTTIPLTTYEEWAKQFGITMPGADDADHTLVNFFKFKQSQHIVMIEKGGKAREIPGGFGRPALDQLNKELSKASGLAMAQIDLSGAPNRVAYG